MNDYKRLHRQAERHERQYPPGTRLILLHMNDPYPVPTGTRGTVICVDSMDQIQTRWDNGRTLALVPDEDVFRKLTPEEELKEQAESPEQEPD